MPVKSVAIVGAGIAGLTAALSFARHGVSSHIIEQAHHLTEVGAGLQISPNASRILSELDVLANIEPLWVEPETIDLTSGQSLKTLMSLPMRQLARARWGAPYGVLHRSTLQQALLCAVLKNPLCHLHLGKRIETVRTADISAITFADQDLIIGADGVWSSARYSVPESPSPSFSGNVAWRFTIHDDVAPSFLQKQSVKAFLGPKGHIVAYPLKEVSAFNVVAISIGADPGQTWKAESTGHQKEMLFEQFRDWHPAIRELLTKTENGNFWPLYQLSEGCWHNGQNTVLIGDSAHAMMPFAAQGAAMAIEDAFELAGQVMLAATLPQGLAAFESLRVPRINKARKRAQMNRFAYHASGPFKLGRDLLFAVRPAQSFAADLDWLYSYHAKG
jgi:salicylate hydroxylase